MGGGRTFLDAYDLDQNPPNRLWRRFLAPPAEGDPEWAIRDCEKGWFFSYKAFYEEGKLGIPCNQVPRENLINDWGVPKHYTSAVSAIWGQMAVDEETGIIYMGTGNQGGWPNQTYTPGPNLYAATTLAIRAMTGEIVWWYQQVPRDMVEGDSSWNTVLTRMSVGGVEKKIIIKFSTTGLMWALDAATGKPIWIFEAPFLRNRVDEDGLVRGRSGGHPCVGCDPSSQDGYWNDVRSHYDMQEKKWLNYPSKEWFYWIPSRAGEADIALNTETMTIYVPIALGVDLRVRAGAFGTLGVIPGSSESIADTPKNVTLFAIDARTGNVKWRYFIDGVAYRGGVMTSGGVVFLPAADGNLYMFDAESGELIHKRFLSTSLLVLPTIGKTSDGESRLFVITGGRAAGMIGGITPVNVPGALMSFGLPESLRIIEPEEDVEEPMRVEEPMPIEPIRRVQERPAEPEKPIAKEVETEIENINPSPYLIAGTAIIILVVAAVLFLRRKVSS